MMRSKVVLFSLAIAACGDDASTSTGTDSGAESSSGGGSSGAVSSTGATDPGGSEGGTQGTSDPTTTTTDPTTTTTSPGTATTGTTEEPDTSTTDDTTGDDTTGEPQDPVFDPDKDGPCEVGELEETIQVGNAQVPVYAYYPTGGPVDGPYPVVTVAHGFNIGPELYTEYARRLASHCYVALNVDHRGYLFQPVDHPAYAKQLLAAVDWAATEPALQDIVDTDNVGTTGHSLGGKISVLAATYDARVKASITLDPVDGATMCPNMMVCPDVSGLLPISIPLGFLGGTLDGDGFMACAPKAENYQTFYAAAGSPALEVTVVGASHPSFVDDVNACGLSCAFCDQSMLDPAIVSALSRAYVVAYFGRHLRGNPGYDTYLTGAEAQARYVDMGYATIKSK